MRRVILPVVLLAAVVWASGARAEEAPVFRHLKVEITGVFPGDLKAVGERCGSAGIDETKRLVAQLGLPEGMVDRNSECRGTRWNVWGDRTDEYIFNFRSLNQNGGTYQTILVYSTEGERVGVYRALNLPLSIDFVERPKKTAFLRLSGEGHWLGESIQWSGLFEVKNGRLTELPNDGGKYAMQRCPSSVPMRLSTEAVSAISETDLQLAICSDEKCTLDCVDKNDPAACEHRIQASYAGSFTSEKRLDVLVGVTPVKDPPGMPKHGAHLYLLQATACGWKVMGRVDNFVGEQEDCDVVRAGDRDFLLCQLQYGPYAGDVYSDVLAAYSVRGGVLRADAPMRTKPLPECHPGELLESSITDVSLGEIEHKGVVPIIATVEAGSVKWKAAKGKKGETCSDATARLMLETRAYAVEFEFGIDGLRPSREWGRKLRTKAIPGVSTGLQDAAGTARRP